MGKKVHKETRVLVDVVEAPGEMRERGSDVVAVFPDGSKKAYSQAQLDREYEDPLLEDEEDDGDETVTAHKAKAKKGKPKGKKPRAVEPEPVEDEDTDEESGEDADDADDTEESEG